MGTFRLRTSCRVENHLDRMKGVEIPDLLVDTGSDYT